MKVGLMKRVHINLSIPQNVPKEKQKEDEPNKYGYITQPSEA